MIWYCVISKCIVEFFFRFNGSVPVSYRCTVASVATSRSCISKLNLTENSASRVGLVCDDADG